MKDRFTLCVAGVLLLSASVSAGLAVPSIQRQRRDLQLVVSTAGTQGMPPHIAVTTAALGTFRGLAVDVLWARAESLQDKGEFFEAQTLSQWITALQPRFPKVWGFQAWNLAYNISVCTTSPEERWRWINRGVDLLRQQGIPLNPSDATLPNELGWMFFHKIGGRTDREHWYYKVRLAREFREFLGDTTGGRTAVEAIERFRRITDADESLDDVRKDPDAARALAVMAEHGAKADESFVRMLGRMILYTNSLDAQLRVGKVLPRGTNRELVSALLADPRLVAAVFERIVPHVQKRVLEDRYRMNPSRMLELLEQYGPLDWAHPHAHGIYWFERSIDLGRNVRHREGINELTVLRTRLANLQHLMRSGRVEFDPLTDRIDILPDPRFIEGYERGIRDAIRLIQSETGVSAAEFGRANIDDLLEGYETFLQQATVFAYLYGDDREAAGCFGKLRQIAVDTGRGEQPLYAEGLEGFLALRLGDVMELDISNTRQFIDAMVHKAMLDGLAKGRLDTFNRFIRLAHSVYDRRYAVTAPGSKHVNKEARLPPFPRLVDASFESAMKQESNPVLVRARIWAWAPEELRGRAWPQLEPILAAHCNAVGLDVTRAFPLPASDKTKSATKMPLPGDTASPLDVE